MPRATRLLLVCLLTSSLCIAQTKAKKPVAAAPVAATEILTNASVIDLVKSGLPNDLIISKIEASQASFDVSSAGLITLKGQKVDNEIIKAMLAKNSGTAPAAKEVAKQLPASVASTAKIDLLNHVYYEATATPLERAVASFATKTKLMGYGGSKLQYSIAGTKSPVRIPQGSNQGFIINTGGTAPELSLYALIVDKKERQAVTMKVKAPFSKGNTTTSGDNVISFATVQLKPGLFQLTPSVRLEKGEYFFAATPSGTTMNVFAFGID